jgi:hypothetical protein
MRRGMIDEVHLDHDPLGPSGVPSSGETRHPSIVGLFRLKLDGIAVIARLGPARLPHTDSAAALTPRPARMSA